MTRIGVPVPSGFSVTTQACNSYLEAGGFPPGMWEQEFAALKELERLAGKKFGDPKDPLLVSCRSGAKFSMPGSFASVQVNIRAGRFPPPEPNGRSYLEVAIKRG